MVRSRVGRRNRYELRPDVTLRHPLVRDYEAGELLRALGASAGKAAA